MTAQELKQTIRSEIEKRIKEYEAKENCEWNAQDHYGDEDALWWQGHRKGLVKFLSFIDSLPDEEETHTLKEWQRVLAERPDLMADFERRTPPQPIQGSIAPEADLEEAAEEYGDYHNDDCFDATGDRCPHIRKAFIAGAEWQKKQMMKETVEGKIYGYGDGSFELIASWLDIPDNSRYKDGDKVKIIIIKP